MKIRNWRRKLSATLAAVGASYAASPVQANITTTLTGVPGSVNNDPIPANHGSTAETLLAWSEVLPDDDWDQYTNWDGRGDVYQINDRVASITFTPANANIKVAIDSFDLDEWSGGGDTTVEWSVSGSVSGLLSSGIWDDKNAANDPSDAGGRTLVSPLAMGAAGETLTLEFDHSASAGFISYLAMDNLTFSSTVIPEPSAAVMAWLGVGGLGALAMRRKRS